MESLRLQHTLARPAVVDGFGYWSGADVRVEFHPAPEDSGVVFERTDLRPRRPIAALVEHRIETPRRTTLASGGRTVEMVEHILAALAGLAIDNCRVRVNAAEMPGCDGSSQPFVDALLAAGRRSQARRCRQLVVTRPLRVEDQDSWIEARPPADGRSGCHLHYTLDYGPGPIGRQELSLELSEQSFLRELAPARTFLLEAEARWLREQGLARRVGYRDVLVVAESGPVGNELRFADEYVRHKALDLLGDLALAGCPLVGQFIAYRSGHRLNAELVRELWKAERVGADHRRTA